MFSLFKTSYKEKRAMVLWRKNYKKKLLARKEVLWHKYGIDSSSVLLGTTKE